MTMAKVIIRNAAYDYKILKPAFFELFDATAGGMVKKGSRVLIKPGGGCGNMKLLTGYFALTCFVLYCVTGGISNEHNIDNTD